ncbi:MAG TPA: helix-turn-helix transcriptional regulator [Candidatus Paceibacterota bacterium]|nr:helix-turn-helix transcriptional regulator [Candidatus Paceibacterota bacterium]
MKKLKNTSNRDAKKRVCPTPDLKGHKCSNHGKALTDLRKEKKMSIKKLSSNSKVLMSTIKKIETGSYRPTTKGILKLAKGLGISPFVLTAKFADQSPVLNGKKAA